MDSFDELTGGSKVIIAAMQKKSEAVPTRTIVKSTGKSGDSVRWHLRENLIPGGWVEVAKSVDEGYPAETNYYRLTNRGRSANLDGEQIHDVEAVANRVDELETTVDDLGSTVTEIKDKLNGLIDHLEAERR